jgi:hypothetical protein
VHRPRFQRRPGREEYPSFELIFSASFDTECAEESLRASGSKWDPYRNGWRDTWRKGNDNPGITSVRNGVINMRLNQRRPSGLPTNSRDQREQQPGPALPAAAGHRRQPRRGGPRCRRTKSGSSRSAAGSIGP